MFWISFDNHPEFTDKQIKMMVDRSDNIIINAPIERNPEYQKLKKLVARIKRQDANTKVLLAVILTRWKPSSKVNTAILDQLFNNNLFGNNWLIPLFNYSKVYIDITNKDYRVAAINQIKRFVNSIKLDGVAVDLAFNLKNLPIYDKLCGQSDICETYDAALLELLLELKSALGEGKFLGFNGLNFLNSFDAQSDLITNTDFTVIEYFGLNPRPNAREKHYSFQNTIEVYLKKFNEFPNSRFFVFARGHWRYTDYEDDLSWQNYLFASYLLASNDKTYYKYHSTFQVPTIAGRSGGLDIYENNFVDLGNPLDSYQKSNTIYFRFFEKGLVLVCPHDSKSGEFKLKRNYYDSDGVKYTGKIRLKASEGKILFNQKPQPIQSTDEIIIENAFNFGELQYLALDNIRSAHNPVKLLINQKVIEPDTLYVFEMEVNDKKRLRETVKFSLRYAQSRRNCPYRFVKTANKLKIHNKQIICLGSTIEIDANRLLKNISRYEFKKWASLSVNRLNKHEKVPGPSNTK